MDDEECHQKKRKEQESDRLPYDDYDEWGSRRPPSQHLENVCNPHKRSIWPLPLQPSLRQPLQYILHQGASVRRDRETPPPQPRSSSRRSRETPPLQAISSAQRDREIPPLQPKLYMEDSCPHERQQRDRVPVASTSRVKELELEVLQIIFSLPESYPPPPMIAVAPILPTPRLVSPPSDKKDYLETPKVRKSGKGKRGGTVVSQRQNNKNWILNITSGPVPELVGARFIKGRWERDNSFRGMLPWNFLYVEADNWVYPGALAYKYYIWDRNGHEGPNPDEARGWTFWAPQGMLWTIQEGKELLKIVANSMADRLERFEAWLILHHFMLASHSFALDQCHHAMTWAADNLPRMHRPGGRMVFDWVPLDPNAFGPVNPHGPPGSLNVRISTPDPSLGLFIDPWVQFILHRGHPGMRNEYYGIIFDHLFHILRRSMWGYLLGQAIAPSSMRFRDARTVVTHEFAYLVVVPTAYIAAVTK